MKKNTFKCNEISICFIAATQQISKKLLCTVIHAVPNRKDIWRKQTLCNSLFLCYKPAGELEWFSSRWKGHDPVKGVRLVDSQVCYGSRICCELTHFLQKTHCVQNVSPSESKPTKCMQLHFGRRRSIGCCRFWGCLNTRVLELKLSSASLRGAMKTQSMLGRRL